MTIKKNHTDILVTSWIHKLPQSWQPYVLLMRLDRPIGVWLLLFPAWWSTILSSRNLDYPQPLKTMILFTLGAVLMRGAGCIINDLWDKEIDAKVERTSSRPLASGMISPFRSIIFLGALLSMSLAIVLQFNYLTILIGVLSLIPVTLYPLAKRITWYPQFALGLTFNIGALMGATAATGNLPTFAWLLYIGGIFWTLGYDTIYAQQDVADDAKIGVKSTALKFAEHIKSYVAGFFILAFLFFFSAGLSNLSSTHSLMLYCVISIFCASHLIWQIVKWNVQDPSSSLIIFRSNFWFATMLFFCYVVTLF